MDYNFHTHTYRCSHADGTEEEYIKRAIENGIKYMGFSDHVPLKFKDGKQSLYRVPAEAAEEYVSTIRALREKYKDQIEIKIGFESEYYPEFFEEMLAFCKRVGAEYLILGQHFVIPECYPSIHSSVANEDEERLCKYVDSLIAAMKTKAFSYIAHPDVFNFVGDSEIYKREIRRLCKASKELDIPIEINFLGIREHRYYPNELLWQVAGEEKSPVTFGFDSHDTLAAYDGESLEIALKLVKKYNLNYIGKPRIIAI